MRYFLLGQSSFSSFFSSLSSSLSSSPPPPHHLPSPLLFSSSSSSSATPPPLPIILKTYRILSYNLIIITLVHGWLTTRNWFRSSTELCMLSLAYLRFLGSMSHSAKFVQVSLSRDTKVASSRSSTALKSFSKKLIYISHSLPRRSNCIPIRIHYMKMNALFSLKIVAGSNAWIIITKALWKHTRTLYVIVSQHDMLFNGVLSILLWVNSPRRLILLL